jgi:predicted Rossmann fold flavoprotein
MPLPFAIPLDAPVVDALILGAGASGLMCAWRAARRGRTVLLADHAAKVGRKLAISGGGKGNVTNRLLSPDDYEGENPGFQRSALARFSPEGLVDMLRDAGIALEEREHGQLFCKGSAREVARFLLDRCRASGCRLALNERVLDLAPGFGPKGDRLFRLRTSRGEHWGRAAVIALGGPAWPQVGATGTALELARRLGHRVIPPRPALCGLAMPEDWPLRGLEGISLPVDIALDVEAYGKAPRRENFAAARGLSLLFTHTGVSGPAALQASLYWRKGAELRINFWPGPAQEATPALAALLDAPTSGKLLCRTLLKRRFPDRLAEALIPPELGDRKCASLSRAARTLLCARVHDHRVTPLRGEGFAKAEVCAGGVDTAELSSQSMESRLVPGLYICGEALDVTGRLGGCNLHWAFASGHAAGEAL